MNIPVHLQTCEAHNCIVIRFQSKPTWRDRTRIFSRTPFGFMESRLPHRYVDDADRTKYGGDEGPAGSLPPLAVDDMHQNSNPAERHEDCPALEAEDAPEGGRRL